ncbi:MAG: hydrogenase maturation protease [Haliscomenobacter sp.]|nr:hydrogenase maturation protease [Haliscomenobacter sp.]
MGDEGVGVHFADSLLKESLPPDVEVLDGGTAGIQLMEAIESHRHVLIVDATLDGLPAGTIREIKPRFTSDYPAAMSTHDIGLKDLISGLTLLGRQPEIFLFVVSIDKVQPLEIGLSPAVDAVLGDIKEKVFQRMEKIRSENSEG